MHSFLLREQHGGEVAAVSQANAPRWCRRVPDEYVLGDVPGHNCGGFIEIARGQGLGRDASPRCGLVKADRHLRAISARLAAAGFHPDPNLEPPRFRPEHPEKLDDRASQATAGDTARLGDGSQAVRPAAARQDRW